MKRRILGRLKALLRRDTACRVRLLCRAAVVVAIEHEGVEFASRFVAIHLWSKRHGQHILTINQVTSTLLCEAVRVAPYSFSEDCDIGIENTGTLFLLKVLYKTEYNKVYQEHLFHQPNF